MLTRGNAKRLTILVDETSHWHGKPLYEAILEMLHSKGVATGVVLRTIAGFTEGSAISTVKILRLSENLPVRIEVVDTPESIERVIPDVYLMVGKGLVTVEDVGVVKFTHVEEPHPASQTVRKVTMNAKQLRIHISEEDSYNGEPLHEAILKRFHAEEFAGLTVYKALEGFGADLEIHRAGRFGLHHKAPIVLIMIDTAENVRRAQQILDGMLDRGVVVVNDVEVTFYGPSARGKSASGPASGTPAP